jgi:DNA-binding NarL/FixJ family response regulator
MTRIDPKLKMVQVLIVDDHPTVREGLGLRIRSEPDMTVCGEAADVEEALRAVKSLEPDVVIVDISLRQGSGLDLIKRLAARDKHVKILVHSMHDESLYARRCLRAGARGYITKQADPRDVICAIRAVLAGKIHVSAEFSEQILAHRLGWEKPLLTDPVEMLTNRELEIFRLMGKGLTASKIAARLCRSVHTIETHRENIKRKLQIHNIAELTHRAVEWVLENP